MSTAGPSAVATLSVDATAQSSLRWKPEGSGQVATMTGQVCVRNLGSEPTENLTIVSSVQVRYGREPYSDIPGAEVLLHPEDLPPGAARCFPVEIEYEPLAHMKDYRHLAVVTVTNGPVYAAVGCSVRSTHCRKPCPPPPPPPAPPPPPPLHAFEVDCILVDKVYDFCYEEEVGLQHCVPVLPSCGIPPAGSTAACTITGVRCTAGTPIPTGVDGLSTVRVTVTTTYDTVIRNAAGTTLCTIRGSIFTFIRTVTVCGPLGTTADCEVRAATCGPCAVLTPPLEGDLHVLVDGTPVVCCDFSFCILVETTAPVKLMVPTFGFCVPARCQTGGFPPGLCPPSPLFPPQCTP